MTGGVIYGNGRLHPVALAGFLQLAAKMRPNNRKKTG
jgi:hypothetical protein